VAAFKIRKVAVHIGFYKFTATFQTHCTLHRFVYSSFEIHLVTYRFMELFLIL